MPREGFTLTEILVVITIAIILFAIVVSGFVGLRENSDIALAVDDSISFLQEARAKTLSSDEASRYGVHFETTMFVLFAGDTYNASDPDNKNRMLPSTVEISNYALNSGGADVVFKRLTGETDEHGTVTFRLTNDPAVTHTIEIGRTGLAHIK